jgi:hypothetical protein
MTLPELFQVAVGAAGGSAVVIGGMALSLGKVWQDRIARLETLAVDLDKDVRNQRTAKYQELWRMTRILPKWPRATGVTAGFVPKHRRPAGVAVRLAVRGGEVRRREWRPSGSFQLDHCVPPGVPALGIGPHAGRRACVGGTLTVP